MSLKLELANKSFRSVNVRKSWYALSADMALLGGGAELPGSAG